MKKIIVSIFVSFLGTASIAQFKLNENEQATAFKEKEDLIEILSLAENLFLEKLNAFRKTKKAQELTSDSAIGLMALNHSIWMRHHEKMTHDQSKNSKFFSGSTLMKRLEFVSEKLSVGLIGENVAYISLTDQDQSKSKVLLAEQIAESFFQLWKKSPPHKENMLEKSFKKSGLSFLKINNIIYGTQVFSD